VLELKKLNHINYAIVFLSLLISLILSVYEGETIAEFLPSGPVPFGIYLMVVICLMTFIIMKAIAMVFVIKVDNPLYIETIIITGVFLLILGIAEEPYEFYLSLPFSLPFYLDATIPIAAIVTFLVMIVDIVRWQCKS